MRRVWVIALGLLVTGCGGKEEAVYQGKPFSYYMKRLKDKDAEAREDAARSMGQMGDAAKAAVPALAEALQDENAGVRKEAADSLGRIGAEAKPAVPALVGEAKDPDKNVRIHAALALSTIDPANPAIVEPIIALLKDPDTDVRKTAVAVLGRIGPEHKEQVVSALKEARKDGDEKVRSMASDAIDNIESGNVTP